MPMIFESHDSLPYIDADPTPTERAAITASLASEVDPSYSITLHPSLSSSYQPSFSPLITNSHDLIASSTKLRVPGTGIDLSRYEEPTVPSSTSAPSDWHSALRAAYTSREYLAQRSANLALLKQYGKDAWLIGNEQLEAELRAVERELAAVKEEVERVEEERRALQGGVRGEIQGLEEAWRDSVGRAIRTEVDAERLRGEILAKRSGG